MNVLELHFRVLQPKPRCEMTVERRAIPDNTSPIELIGLHVEKDDGRVYTYLRKIHDEVQAEVWDNFDFWFEQQLRDHRMERDPAGGFRQIIKAA